MGQKKFWLLAGCLLLFSESALAACHDWPLRRGEGNRYVFDADTIYVSLPGLPKPLADVVVEIRGIVAPRVKFGSCVDEKRHGLKARTYVVKLLSTAKSVRFCEPEWHGESHRILAKVMFGEFDLARVLLDKGYARPAEKGRKTWCGG